MTVEVSFGNIFVLALAIKSSCLTRQFEIAYAIIFIELIRIYFRFYCITANLLKIQYNDIRTELISTISIWNNALA